MKVPIPIWKKYLSYLFEIHLESVESDVNEHLYVCMNKGRVQLCTGNAIYSYEDLYDNFSESFAQIDFNRLDVNEVLLLGFGLGSVPILLEKSFGGIFNFTAVEIDESVIYLANKYLGDTIQSSLEIVHADALAYVFQTEKKFDLIAMDIFVDDKVPRKFETTDFLLALKERLHPGGLLMYNRLASTPQDTFETQKFYESVFQPVFNGASYLQVWANWMLLNRKDVIKEDYFMDRND